MTTTTDKINAQFKSIIEDVKGLPETLKSVDVADLQKQAQGFAQTAVGTATSAYADVAKKAEELVAKAKTLDIDDFKKTVDGLKTKAEDVAGDVSDKAEELAGDAQKAADEFVKDAKATVTKVTGQKAPAKPAAKKAPAKKAPAKPAAKKAPAKKAPAKKA